jgi:hypothetical protein
MFANSILALGVDFGRVSSSPSYFTGKLSNFKIYNAYLEASEAKKLYNLGRTGRSMVISDTAVGIGKVPEAQLDVKGTIKGINMTKCPVFFDASAQSTTAAGADMNFNTVHYNVGGGLSGTTFTAPVAGHYYFSIFFMGTYASGAKQLWVSIWKNGGESHGTNSRIYNNYDINFGSGQHHGQNAGSAILHLEVGEYVKMKNEGNQPVHGQYNRFQGFLLSA